MTPASSVRGKRVGGGGGGWDGGGGGEWGVGGGGGAWFTVWHRYRCIIQVVRPNLSCYMICYI